MLQSCFWNIRVTFEIFKLLEKLPDENGKFIISDIDLLRTVWNNFKNLLGILADSTYLLLLDFFITDTTLSRFVGATYKERNNVWICLIFVLFMFWFYYFFFCKVFVEFISEENLHRYNISFFLLWICW